MSKRSLIATLAALGFAHAASGQDLFQFTLTPTGGGGPAPITGTGSSLWDLTSDVIDTQGAFASFNGVAFGSSLRYAGVDDAIQYNMNAAGDSATLTFSALGAGAQTFSFTGSDIEGQIEEFFKKGAEGQLEEFMKEMAKQSLVFIVDGNPSATTARASRYRYNRFGMMDDLRPRYAPVTRTGTISPTDPGEANAGEVQTPADQPQTVDVTDSVDSGGSTLRFDFSGGVIDSDVGKGNDYRFTVSNEFRFGDRIALVVGVPVSYHEIEGSDAYHVAGHVDLPITLVRRTEMNGWTWKVTPGLLASGSGSIDFIAGGLLWGAGVTNVIGYDYGPWSFSVISQYDTYESVKLEYDDYEFDPGVSQKILTNGLRVAYRPDESWYLYGGLAYTDFLEDAAVDNYLSPTIGGGFRTEHGWNVNLGYEGDTGDGFDAHRLAGGIQWSF